MTTPTETPAVSAPASSQSDAQLAELEARFDQELNHRIKNVFAVVSALIALSARQHPEAQGFAASVRTRIQALARAHDFVRPHTADAAPGGDATTLHAFLRELMAPYAEADAVIDIAGDDAIFDDQAATPVALLFHELATNAAKFGALSQAGGRVTIRTALDDGRFTLVWSERGGPAAVAPEDPGFGTTLANLAVEGQLGGDLRRDWDAEGLTVTATLPVTALSRRRFSEQNREPDSG